MKTLHEAAQMALDALERCVKLTDAPYDAMDALREALADKPEPVAWYLPSPDGDDSIFRDHRTVIACNGNKWEGFLPLYAAPAQPVPQPTPRTAGCLMCGHCAATGERIAAPVVREPLTIDQEKALSAEAKTGPFQHTTPVVGNDMQSGETLRLSSKRHAGSTPPLAAPQLTKREHEASADCWCEPEIDYTDPDTGISVYVHKDVQ